MRISSYRDPFVTGRVPANTSRIRADAGTDFRGPEALI